MTRLQKVTAGATGAAMAALVAYKALVVPPAPAVRVEWVAGPIEDGKLSNWIAHQVVQSRTNLRVGPWVDRTNVPYKAGSNSVVLPRDKRAEFFRAGWRWK